VSRYQKDKTNLDLTKARDSEWQWHQLGHTQVCTTLQTNNHASTPPLRFLQAGSCRPTNSVKALSDQLSQNLPDRSSPNLKGWLWLWMIKLKLVLWSPKGRCYGNQFLLVLSRELSSDAQNWVSEFRRYLPDGGSIRDKLSHVGRWAQAEVVYGETVRRYPGGLIVGLWHASCFIMVWDCRRERHGDERVAGSKMTMTYACLCLWCRRLTHTDTAAAAAAATRGHTDRVQWSLHWPVTLTVSPQQAIIMIRVRDMQTIKVKDHLVQ